MSHTPHSDKNKKQVDAEENVVEIQADEEYASETVVEEPHEHENKKHKDEEISADDEF